ncbi:hypothetical protein GGR19_001695 [Croceicoccus naphthovorans]|nr:hypothetical protein [Croceicoccus naphthovorans]
MDMSPLTTPLRCTAREVVTAIVRASALRHGCTSEEAATIRVGTAGGIHPCLASVRAGDGREVLRVDDIKHLDRIARSISDCTFLARAIRRACVK